MKLLRLVVAFFVLVLLPGILFAQEFSADTVTVLNGKVMTGKLYCSRDRWRIEMSADERHQVSIIRKDKNIIWHIADQQKQYLEFPLREEGLPVAIGQKILGEVKREKLGKETINGRSVMKYKVYFKVKNQEGFTYQWVDEEYKIPIRSSYEGGQYTSEIKNIVPGAQPAALFELPSDVTPYTIPMTR